MAVPPITTQAAADVASTATVKATILVGATGSAVSSNISGNPSLAQQLEAAQVQAIHECYDAGTTDPETIRARTAAARAAILNEG